MRIWVACAQVDDNVDVAVAMWGYRDKIVWRRGTATPVGMSGEQQWNNAAAWRGTSQRVHEKMAPRDLRATPDGEMNEETTNVPRTHRWRVQ